MQGSRAQTVSGIGRKGDGSVVVSTLDVDEEAIAVAGAAAVIEVAEVGTRVVASVQVVGAVSDCARLLSHRERNQLSDLERWCWRQVSDGHR